MTADVKFTRRGNALYRKHQVQSALAALSMITALVLWGKAGEVADGNALVATLLGLAAGLAAILTIRFIVHAAAYLAVTAMVDAFGPDGGDDR